MIALFAVVATACETGSATSPGSTSSASLTANLTDAGGKQVATVILADAATLPVPTPSASPASPERGSSPRTSGLTGVAVIVRATDLPPGTHGFHVHSVARCDAPDFSSSGAILNPRNRSHGFNNPNGPKAGDLPNLDVQRDRTAESVFIVHSLTMADLSSSRSGTSLVVDAAPDDDISDPSGNSGAGIACGVVVASAQTPTATPTPTRPPANNNQMTPTPTMRPTASPSMR